MGVLGREAEVDFVLDEGLPFGLLGYEGFLNKWAVSFNAANGYFVADPTESFAGRIPPDTFESSSGVMPANSSPELYQKASCP